MFIRPNNLNRKNCTIQKLRFVKSITRRPKIANVWISSDFIVEAKLHAYPNSKVRKWDKKKPGCYGYCSSEHLTIFAANERLFFISKSEPKEFVNPWLLKHIMTTVFKERE